jgi:hypothetical protein
MNIHFFHGAYGIVILINQYYLLIIHRIVLVQSREFRVEVQGQSLNSELPTPDSELLNICGSVLLIIYGQNGSCF